MGFARMILVAIAQNLTNPYGHPPLPAFDEAKDALRKHILKGVSTALKGFQY